MSKIEKCQCGCTEFETDGLQGDRVCRNCGRIVESQALVNELTFENTNVHGKFGQKSGNYTQIKALASYNQESRQQRLNKAYKIIQRLAYLLNLSHYHVEAAKRLYNLAHIKNFIQGRHTSHVAAACLYIVCREEKTPHFLLDFSNAIQINLYILGSCFLKLVNALHLELPLIDPSIFIHRFVSDLDFGDKAPEVTRTAIRLLQRMKIDWISFGRRPASLCGACILISARYHGFNRTTQQIVQAVHVCDGTIRKRLEEFKETSIAKLTREEFEKFDLVKDIPENMEPPSFRLSKTKPLTIRNVDNEIEANANQISTLMQTEVFTPPVVYEPIAEDHDDIEDISESEINEFFLSEEESSLKSMIWHNMHKEWLDEQDRKAQIQDSAKKTGNSEVKLKKKRPVIQAATAMDSILTYSKIGKKINKEMLKELFADQLQETTEEEGSKKVKGD